MPTRKSYDGLHSWWLRVSVKGTNQGLLRSCTVGTPSVGSRRAGCSVWDQQFLQIPLGEWNCIPWGLSANDRYWIRIHTSTGNVPSPWLYTQRRRRRSWNWSIKKGAIAVRQRMLHRWTLAYLMWCLIPLTLQLGVFSAGWLEKYVCIGSILGIHDVVNVSIAMLRKRFYKKHWLDFHRVSLI